MERIIATCSRCGIAKVCERETLICLDCLDILNAETILHDMKEVVGLAALLVSSTQFNEHDKENQAKSLACALASITVENKLDTDLIVRFFRGCVIEFEKVNQKGTR